MQNGKHLVSCTAVPQFTNKRQSRISLLLSPESFVLSPYKPKQLQSAKCKMQNVKWKTFGQLYCGVKVYKQKTKTNSLFPNFFV